MKSDGVTEIAEFCKKEYEEKMKSAESEEHEVI